MTTVDLKERIIEQVKSTEDEAILAEVHFLLKAESTKFYEMTEPELEAVKEALQDSKAGKVYSSEQANQMIQEWLKK